MSRPTKTSKQLRHEFTPAELAELGGKLADQYDHLQNENERFESDKAHHKAEISGIEKEVARLSRLIRTRSEERLTECYFRWNTPIDGVVQIVRNDTGEIIQERSMSDDERQEELPLEVATAPETTEAPAETTAAAETVKDDELYNDAVSLCREGNSASTSLLQRRLRIGYGRATHLIDLMEQRGVVGPANGLEPRIVLPPPTEQQQTSTAAAD